MRWVIGLLLLVVPMFVLPASIEAQVDPRGAYRTFNTPHFKVHFRIADDSIARRAAVIAEEAYRALSAELVQPDTPIELLLTDNLDLSNGNARIFPSNRIVIYLLPPTFVEELRFYGDWLRLVITHELAHVYHLDRSRGLWAFGRKIFGRHPALFPNVFTPSWVKEGLAVHYETALTGTGRNAATQFRTVAGAAALEGRIPPPNQWSLATSRFPEGQTAYAWGSLLMNRAATHVPDSGMRRFIESTASHIIPFRLGRSSRIAFGKPFSTLFDEMRDSLLSEARSLDRSGDSAWLIVSQQGFYAASPRWIGNDSVMWSASNGREVPGLYKASIVSENDADRVARRNSLDANVRVGDRVVFAQLEFRDPYIYRTDLYSARDGRERRLTTGARLAQPDVRSDGAIVAAQLLTGITRLVRVSADGRRITPLTRNSTSSWAEPRWSPRGDAIAAVELLASGEQRIVVLDTLGSIREIVAGGRAVFSSPSFTPDGARLVWVSDRSGRSQLETAPLGSVAAAPGSASQSRVDTSRWRVSSGVVRTASNVTTGVFEPSVSPDGRHVAALVYRLSGWHVAVTPLDTNGPVAENRWYAASDTLGRRVSATWTNPTAAGRVMDTLQSRRYNVIRQILPRYWMPAMGTGRTGDLYGASTSGVDITGRHEWIASATFNNDLSEMDAYTTYRFAGMGVPVFDLTLLQEFDATFRTIDTEGNFVGDVARRRRFATLSSTWVIPRVRRSLVASAGTQFELRKFASDSDAALGPAGSITRRGTTYQSFFGTLSASTTRAGARAISAEEGLSVAASTAYRWRTDAPQQTESWRSVGVVRGFLPIPLPGFARHVLAMRVAGGTADRRTASEFSLGGVSGVSSVLIPGVNFGEPSRTFPVRGIDAGVQRGSRAISGTIEYRAPLVLLSKAPGPLPLFADRLSLNAFGDAGRAWCPAGVRMLFASTVCDTRQGLDGWIATAGAELSLDFAAQYDVPYRLRVGVGVPVITPSAVPGGAKGYITFGSYF